MSQKVAKNVNFVQMHRCSVPTYKPECQKSEFFVWIHIDATTKFGNLASVCLNRL